MPYRAEYIWIDGTEPTPLIRSKTKIIETGKKPGIWGFDGSSTNQAPGSDSDCVLQPVFECPDPTRGDGDILVLCEVLLPGTLEPHGVINNGAVFFLNKGALAFGNVPLGQPSAAQIIVVANVSSNYYSGVLHTSLGGANAGEFAITNDTCNLIDLAPGETCTLGVRLQPAQTGALGAVLAIAGGNGTRTVALSGSGI